MRKMEIVEYYGSSSELMASLRSVFYLTASNVPENEDERREFLQLWLGDYVISPTGLHFVALESDRVVGYLISETQTLRNLEILNKHTTLLAFRSWFKEYSSHFHINVHPDVQGQGVGRKLVERFLQSLLEREIEKTCLVTGRFAENVKFYKNMGFLELETKDLKGTQLVLLGRDTNVV